MTGTASRGLCFCMPACMVSGRVKRPSQPVAESRVADRTERTAWFERRKSDMQKAATKIGGEYVQ